MRIPLLVLGVVLLLVGGMWFLPHEQFDGEGRTDLPWQITPLPDGTSRIFNLHLGTATLADAIARFGEPESIALFVGNGADRSLEAYFGKVLFGPLEARIIVTLAADTGRLDALAANAVGRDRTPSGNAKLLLTDADKAALINQQLFGVTYIPAYGGLGAEFFRERLGEPAEQERVNEHAVSWFYPELGLSLLIDADGKDVFEYVAPRDFRMPPGATAAAP